MFAFYYVLIFGPLARESRLQGNIDKKFLIKVEDPGLDTYFLDDQLREVELALLDPQTLSPKTQTTLYFDKFGASYSLEELLSERSLHKKLTHASKIRFAEDLFSIGNPRVSHAARDKTRRQPFYCLKDPALPSLVSYDVHNFSHNPSFSDVLAGASISPKSEGVVEEASILSPVISELSTIPAQEFVAAEEKKDFTAPAETVEEWVCENMLPEDKSKKQSVTFDSDVKESKERVKKYVHRVTSRVYEDTGEKVHPKAVNNRPKIRKMEHAASFVAACDREVSQILIEIETSISKTGKSTKALDNYLAAALIEQDKRLADLQCVNDAGQFAAQAREIAEGNIVSIDVDERTELLDQEFFDGGTRGVSCSDPKATRSYAEALVKNQKLSEVETAAWDKKFARATVLAERKAIADAERALKHEQAKAKAA